MACTLDGFDAGSKVRELQKEWERSRAFLAKLEANISELPSSDGKAARQLTAWAAKTIDDGEEDFGTPSPGGHATTLSTKPVSSSEAQTIPRSRRAPSEPSSSLQADALPAPRRPTIPQIVLKLEPPDEHGPNGLFGDGGSAFRPGLLFMPRQPKTPDLQPVHSLNQRGTPPAHRTRLLRAATLDENSSCSSSGGSCGNWVGGPAPAPGPDDVQQGKALAAATTHAAPHAAAAAAHSAPVMQAAGFKTRRRLSMDCLHAALVPTVIGPAYHNYHPRCNTTSTGSRGYWACDMAATAAAKSAAGAGTGAGFSRKPPCSEVPAFDETFSAVAWDRNRVSSRGARTGSRRSFSGGSSGPAGGGGSVLAMAEHPQLLLHGGKPAAAAATAPVPPPPPLPLRLVAVRASHPVASDHQPSLLQSLGCNSPIPRTMLGCSADGVVHSPPAKLRASHPFPKTPWGHLEASGDSGWGGEGDSGGGGEDSGGSGYISTPGSSEEGRSLDAAATAVAVVSATPTCCAAAMVLFPGSTTTASLTRPLSRLQPPNQQPRLGHAEHQ